MNRGKEILKPVSTVDALVNKIIEFIFNSNYKAGEYITEQSISEYFGVSRNTVREAFYVLIQKGLLTKQMNRSVCIKVLTEKDILEIYELRNMLEKEAVIQIEKKGQGICKQVEESFELIKGIDREKDWSRYVEADSAFHRAIVKSSQNERLIDLYDNLLYEVKLCIYQTRNPSPIEIVKEHHNLIMEALKKENFTRVKKVISEHIEISMQNVLRQLNSK